MATGDVVQYVNLAGNIQIDGTVVLPSAPTFGNTLVLARIRRNGAPADAPAAGAWTITPAGSTQLAHGIDGMDVRYRPVVLGDGTAVSVRGVSSVSAGLLIELEGALTLDDFAATETDGLAVPADYICGDVTPTTGAPGIVLSFIGAVNGEQSGDLFTADATWTELAESQLSGGHPQMTAVYKVIASAAGSYTAGATAAGGTDGYVTQTLALMGDAAPPAPGLTITIGEAEISEASEKVIRVLQKDTGTGQFRLNRKSAQATAINLAQGNLAKVTYPAISADPIFAFFLDTGDFDLISTDEEGGEDLLFAGKGVLSYLKRAQMWDRSFLESLNHVSLGPGSVWIYTKSGADLVSRTSVSFASATVYSAGAAETLDWPGHGTKYLDRTYVPITEGPHTGKYVHTSYLTVPFVGDGTWRLFASGTGSAPGQILKRIIDEAQAAGRPLQEIPALTYDFTATLDSDGNAWDDGGGATDEFTAQVGEDLLSVVLRLVDTGTIDVVMDHELVLHAYNSYGEVRTGVAFGAGVVRFERGVNIADVLRRSVGLELPATHILVDGDEGVTATAELADAASRPTVAAYARLEGTDPTALAAAGLALLEDELRRLESVVFPIAVGDDPLVGRYLPGPAGTNGHFWVGDFVTIDTGGTTIDFIDQTARTAGLTISEDEAGNIQTAVEAGHISTLRSRWWTDGILRRRGSVDRGFQPGREVIVSARAPSEVDSAGATVDPADLPSHGELDGLGDDDHPQYTTDAEATALAAAEVAGHTGDATDAHDASAISVADAGGVFTGTDVEAVLAELETAISGGGIPATIFDAKGDLIAASAADTAARLAAGGDEADLISLASESTGLKWRKNTVTTTDPTVNDDSGDGFRPGSRWLNLTGAEEFVCLDATVGAAVWVSTTATGAGGTVDIEDEGSAEGAADTIDFTGAGVSVTFAAGTATVDIPGGGGSAIEYGSLKPATPTMDFTGSDLAGATAHSSQGSFATGDAYEAGVDGSHLVIGYRNSMGSLYWGASNVDQELICGGIEARGTIQTAAAMYGIALLDINQTGVGVIIYNDGNAYLADIVTGQYNTNYGQIASLGHDVNGQPHLVYAMRLTRVGNTWDGYISLTGNAWDFHMSATGSKTITVARKAFGLFYSTGTTTYKGRLICDYLHTV